MLYVSWGKKGKLIAYAGIEKCSNCLNWTHFSFFETKKKVNVYFIPVAAWDKKTYLVCGLCEAAVELAEHSARDLITECQGLPPQDKAIEIWDYIADNFESALKSNNNELEGAIPCLVEQLNNRYPEDWVRYIFGRLIQSVHADNPPE
ncbi:MAG: zinc-ribbon domain-containing protein [Planctomycetes bacterium]|jgi:hypothetical protein|nr:zinc-ribbon domain-containing protein [Planctomycetota bacterium]